MSIHYEMTLPEIVKEMQLEEIGIPRTGFLTGERLRHGPYNLIKVDGVYMPHQGRSSIVNGESAAHACHELSRVEREVVGVAYYRGNTRTDILRLAKFTKTLQEEIDQQLALIVVDHLAKEIYRIEKLK